MAANLCPVCGYPELDEPAYDEHGYATFEICPCCSVEFGYDDATRSHAELRADWVERGRTWWSTWLAPEPGWDPVRQVAYAEAREHVVALARQMLAGTIDLLRGCRAIAGQQLCDADRRDPDVLTFAAVDSETDGISMPDQPHEEYLERTGGEIRRACTAVIATFVAKPD